MQNGFIVETKYQYSCTETKKKEINKWHKFYIKNLLYKEICSCLKKSVLQQSRLRI